MIKRKVDRESDINRTLDYHPTDYLLVITRGEKTNFPMKVHAVMTTKTH